MEKIIKDKRVCIICFPELALPLAESVSYKGAKLIDIRPHTNLDFPRDYDTYIVHLGNVHGNDRFFEPEILRKLKEDNPCCRIYAFSGSPKDIEKSREFVDGSSCSLDLISFIEGLK